MVGGCSKVLLRFIKYSWKIEVEWVEKSCAFGKGWHEQMLTFYMYAYIKEMRTLVKIPRIICTQFLFLIYCI